MVKLDRRHTVGIVWLQVGLTLASGEILRKCPRCKSPVLTTREKDRAQCTSDSCDYDVCVKCEKCYHGRGAVCRPVAHSAPGSIGSRVSRRNLQRLSKQSWCDDSRSSSMMMMMMMSLLCQLSYYSAWCIILYETTAVLRTQTIVLRVILDSFDSTALCADLWTVGIENIQQNCFSSWSIAGRPTNSRALILCATQ